MAGSLELLVSTEKYENRISMLETFLSSLESLAAEYETLQGQVSSFAGGSDQVAKLQQNVQINVTRVNKAIEATRASIQTLQNTVTTMSNVGQNINTIIEGSINAASAFL